MTARPETPERGAAAEELEGAGRETAGALGVAAAIGGGGICGPPVAAGGGVAVRAGGSPVRFMIRPRAPAGAAGRAPGVIGFCAAARRLAAEAVWMPPVGRRTVPLATGGAAGRAAAGFAAAGCFAGCAAAGAWAGA